MLQPRFTFQNIPISIAQLHDFLKELPLFKFYDEIERISKNPNDNPTECDTLTGFNTLQEICYKIVYILDNITQFSNLVDVANNNYRSCKYLKYLVQEEIEKEECDSYTLRSLYEALNKYKSPNGNYECIFEQNTNTDTNINHTTKELYYYAEYLYWIKENLKYFKYRGNKILPIS
ncbi:hypothetical protein PCYB_003970 [Plasmodium cynomolgi strain B]|uniref:CYIR protein n=1 Tax=Plasmodium cynomolgi (strain B) TaxID=1120755 RepID=K6UNN2_PLACD|nr:hypothetical protein PCYB_003970 [Plasmodium cynomolgi strain B]GAB69648.1 hypothetical protein PCYB_003970 [Plasmodium cynomolgi strain B]